MRKDSYQVRVKSIDQANVAIGNKARAANTIIRSGVEAESLRNVISEAEELIRLLGEHRAEVEDPDTALAAAVKARDKLGKKKIDIESVGKALKRVAAAVADVGVLAEAVTRVQALVAHLLS